MPNDNEFKPVEVPAVELEGQTTLEEQIETAEVEAPAENKEEGKPVGPATIVDMETPMDNFPAHNDDPSTPIA